VDDLKYQKQPAAEPKGPEVAVSNELLTVKLRYKEPEGQVSKLLEFPITDAGTAYAKASEDYKFAAAVAALGMILRESPHKGTASYASVTELAQEGLGNDESGYRAEFIDLVRKAAGLGRR
jgi:Ca-activated chloride channel family protein